MSEFLVCSRCGTQTQYTGDPYKQAQLEGWGQLEDGRVFCKDCVAWRGKVIRAGVPERKHTKGPWEWEPGEYECGFPCTPNGCRGHSDGIPHYLEPVGIWVEEYPQDLDRWIADAALMAGAPRMWDLLAKRAQDGDFEALVLLQEIAG